MSFEDAGREIIQGLKAGLYQAGLDIMYVSQTEVPVDTGTLRASGRVLEPERIGDTVSCTIGYGYGEQINPKTGQLASQYAVPVHERLDVTHAPPTKAKFLEDPARAYQALFGEAIRVSIQAWVRDFPLGRRGSLIDYMRQVRPSAAAEGLASNLASVSGGDARRAAIAEVSGLLASLRGE